MCWLTTSKESAEFMAKKLRLGLPRCRNKKMVLLTKHHFFMKALKSFAAFGAELHSALDLSTAARAEFWTGRG